MRAVLVPSLSAVFVAAALPAQTSSNMVLESHTAFAPCTTGDVWAIGGYMLVARRSQGFAVIDPANPTQPKLVRPPGYPVSSSSYGIGDIKSDGRYIYATNEYSPLNVGVFIYDAGTDPMNPTYVGAVSHANVPQVHNCWIDPTTDVLYCVGRGLIQAFDVSNKAAPVFLATLGSGLPGVSSHDVIVLDNRAYCSFWQGGIAIYDVSIPANPQLIVHKPYANSATHNMWPTEDRNYLYTTDENQVGGVGGAVRIWDISNLPAITQVGSYKAGAVDSVVHNVQVHDDLLFVSYYKEGVRVCSILDPKNPVEIAHYDTYPSAGAGCFGGPYAGCWGVYPWDRFHVFVSDLDSGAYVMRLNPVTHTFSARAPTVPPGGVMTLDFTYKNDAPTTLNAFGLVFFTRINNAPTPFLLLADVVALSPAQIRPSSFPIPIPVGFPTGVPVDFRAYSGTFDPLIVSQTTDVRVTIQ